MYLCESDGLCHSHLPTLTTELWTTLPLQQSPQYGHPQQCIWLLSSPDDV
jgi:hypothetical protein